MLVYEGGLSTSFSSLRANMYLSVAVALTGIGIPMTLSFILMELVSATPLQAFAAGAALSATSLGTTFTILSTTGLITTRLGMVTTSAAMLDDVAGLVMVQIISNLGVSGDSFSAVTVDRPLFVSLGFGIGVVLACRFVLRPNLLRVLQSRDKLPGFVSTRQFAFLGYTSLLVGLAASATYAGTSGLFAAYLAGVISSWFDDLLPPMLVPTTEGNPSHQEAPSQPASSDSFSHWSSEPSQASENITGIRIYEHYYQGPVNRILIPMFFASIGFAIPITEMIQGSVVWRGFVYAILMTFGKMCTGLWLVRVPPLSGLTSFVRVIKAPMSYATSCLRRLSKSQNEKSSQTNRADASEPIQDRDGTAQKPSNRSSEPDHSGNREIGEVVTSINNDPPSQRESDPRARSVSSLSPKPKSLYPASILSLAMVARGEIGYLIASLAESNGIFGQSSQGSSEGYLVVLWAISLCTLVGPISVGTLVKRVKTLQRQRMNSNTGIADPLGVWGI
ncbi:Sodium/hydrogen exchanger family-domain-containing protein [Aspergillus desertorum]